MADIVFITPNTQTNANEAPIGTLLLATILRSHGLSVDILSFSQLGDPADSSQFLSSAADRILAQRPGIVSFYTRCDTYHVMIRLADELKRRAQVYTVFGGPQADISAIETLTEIPCVDFICRGEGETTIYPLFSSLLAGNPDLTVPGLVYRRDGAVLENPRPALIEDLDSLPEVDYTLLDAEDIRSAQPFPIDVGRGCPFSCTYCSTKSFWGRKYRLKSPRRIYSEVLKLHEEYGITQFSFAHDMFTMNREKVIETCELLKQLDFPIIWKCSARIDCLDPELIDIMVSAGMRSIFIGIETGSPRMQKIIKKNLKLDSVLPMLAHIQSKGVHTTTSFIFGFPQETEEDISLTLSLMGRIAQLQHVQIDPHLCTFLPGTELSTAYLNDLTPAINYSDITGGGAAPEYSDLIDAHPNLFWHFREYKTELRARLEYFTVFVKAWSALQPAYQFFSERYSDTRMIDMYFDFVQDNLEVLEQTKHLSLRQRVRAIVENDRFAKRFCDNEYAEFITSFYRMKQLSYPDAIGAAPVTELYPFSPMELKTQSRLQDYRRGLFIVTYIKQPDNSVQMRIQSKG